MTAKFENLRTIVAEKEAVKSASHQKPVTINRRAVINPGRPKASGVDATVLVNRMYSELFRR